MILYTMVHKNRILHNRWLLCQMLTNFHIFALLERELNFQQNPHDISHLTFTFTATLENFN